MSPTLRITQVVDSPNKILLIDESHETADDGCWAWQDNFLFGQGQNVIANRHDRKKEAAKAGGSAAALDVEAGFGNAAFVDGHAEAIERIASWDRFHYDPLWRGGSVRKPGD